jgi:hypothetical protein
MDSLSIILGCFALVTFIIGVASLINLAHKKKAMSPSQV